MYNQYGKLFGSSLQIYVCIYHVTYSFHSQVFTKINENVYPHKILCKNASIGIIHYVQNWKQPKCPSFWKWFKELWQVPTMEYY